MREETKKRLDAWCSVAEAHSSEIVSRIDLATALHAIKNDTIKLPFLSACAFDYFVPPFDSLRFQPALDKGNRYGEAIEVVVAAQSQLQKCRLKLNTKMLCEAHMVISPIIQSTLILNTFNGLNNTQYRAHALILEKIKREKVLQHA